MEPEKLAIAGVVLVTVTVGLLIGVSFLTFPTGDVGGNDPPLTKYTTDRDLAELELSVPSSWSFEMSDGSTLDLSDLLGQVVVVDLMATWCPSCNTQNTYLAEVSENLAGTAVVISLTVDDSETISMMADYKSTKQLDWAHGLDTDSSFENYFNVQNIPTLVLIDATGVFRYLHIGVWTTAALSTAIASIL
jgi:thiol-disulfide isomerase/thioredoxin